MLDSENIKDTLDKLLSKNDRVFIVPHNRPDMDALGAAIGMSLICTKNKKKSYIVINDDIDKLKLDTKKLIEEISKNFNVIKASDILEYTKDNNMMIFVDVNKRNLISTKDYLEIFDDILVIDHHKVDEKTIKTPYLYVDEKMSSACEEISRLLFLYDDFIDEKYASYLLAGIILDTNRFMLNTDQDSCKETFRVIYKLMEHGADMNTANNVFLEDFERDRAIQRLIDNTEFLADMYAVACEKSNEKIYDIEDLAKAANYLLRFPVNATFALGYIDNETISISARSKGTIDVSKVMRVFGGSGNEHSAAARIKGMSIEGVKRTLNEVLVPDEYLNYVDLDSYRKDEGMTLKLTK